MRSKTAELKPEILITQALCDVCAVAGRVYPLDANSFCSRPGPRVVEGVERIARLLHPEVAPA